VAHLHTSPPFLYGIRHIAAMNVAATVRDYLAVRPALQQGLGMGVINLSALARLIGVETGLDADLAIQAACRRYKVPPAVDDQRLRALLSQAQLDVRTRMSVVNTRHSWSIGRRLEGALRHLRANGGTAHVVHGSEAVTIIVDTSHVDLLLLELPPEDVREVRNGLAQVNVRTPGDVEDVPGVLVRVASVLSTRGINFVEVLSCHKDNLFLVSERDLSATLEALAPILGEVA
jgi:hypothetical protein